MQLLIDPADIFTSLKILEGALVAKHLMEAAHLLEHLQLVMRHQEGCPCGRLVELQILTGGLHICQGPLLLDLVLRHRHRSGWARHRHILATRHPVIPVERLQQLPLRPLLV